MPSKYNKKHQVTLRTGNGCKKHDNCFTCFFHDCEAHTREFRTLRNKYYTYDEQIKIIAISF